MILSDDEKSLDNSVRTRALESGLSMVLILGAAIYFGSGFTEARAGDERHGVQAAAQRQISFADRVAYQYAIEEVYWRHRIWPKENARSKPPLDQVMSPAQIQQKVEDYLRNSQLLAERWQSPITPAQLQAEMERMASRTKQPEVLQELFSVLGNDPAVIAECLARPVLSERLTRDKCPLDEKPYRALEQTLTGTVPVCMHFLKSAFHRMAAQLILGP